LPCYNFANYFPFHLIFRASPSELAVILQIQLCFEKVGEPLKFELASGKNFKYSEISKCNSFLEDVILLFEGGTESKRLLLSHFIIARA